jgi:hypothetical protein
LFFLRQLKEQSWDLGSGVNDADTSAASGYLLVALRVHDVLHGGTVAHHTKRYELTRFGGQPLSY